MRNTPKPMLDNTFRIFSMMRINEMLDTLERKTLKSDLPINLVITKMSNEFFQSLSSQYLDCY